MKKPQQLVIFTVVASMLVGAGAGVTASLFTNNALEEYATALLGDRGFTALEPRKPNTNPLDYDEAVRRVRDTEARSVAIIATKTIDSTVAEKWIGASDAAGLGVVASANGWILTTDAEISSFQNPVTGAEVWVRGTRYAIGQVVKDDLTDYVLLKLVDASGLSAVGFGSSEDSRDGDMIFLAPTAVSMLSGTLENSELSVLSGPQPVEKYVTAWDLSGVGAESGPVFSAAGDLLAFATPEQSATPFHHAAAFVQEVIRNGVGVYVGLGAYVVDLSDVYNLDPELRQGLSTGALVYAPTGKLAVPAKTPAAVAGLLAKDIITAVEGEALTANTSLSELLATYKPGQTVRLSVVRAGSPIELSATLGDLSALVY